mmetsp:Transcript_22889/g.74694  ORF Transcript_22889/g.74694 Transcript_22889/m.74694 type:complete len:205 (+) Transcript_22889:319-933(+)
MLPPFLFFLLSFFPGHLLLLLLLRFLLPRFLHLRVFLRFILLHLLPFPFFFLFPCFLLFLLLLFPSLFFLPLCLSPLFLFYLLFPLFSLLFLLPFLILLVHSPFLLIGLLILDKYRKVSRMFVSFIHLRRDILTIRIVDSLVLLLPIAEVERRRRTGLLIPGRGIDQVYFVLGRDGRRRKRRRRRRIFPLRQVHGRVDNAGDFQ